MRRGLLLALPLLVVAAALWARFTAPAIASLPPLANGDLVFQTDRSTQMLAILFATGSLYTHVGIIDIDQSGRPFVLEAAGKVRRIPLQDWLHHGYARRLTIERLSGLDAATAAKITAKAETYIGTPYDIFFRLGTDHLYCSELVYDAFLQGGQIELGKLQSVSDLNINNFAVRKIIETRWQRDPEFQPASAINFKICFARIQQQQIITPVSLARDRRLKIIFSNYGLL
jgi:cell wall-associated NlpC family hydrolase